MTGIDGIDGTDGLVGLGNFALETWLQDVASIFVIVVVRGAKGKWLKVCLVWIKADKNCPPQDQSKILQQGE